MRKRIVAIDLFCGAGGLTRGLLDAEIEVVTGYDIDEECKHAYEHNNRPAVFEAKSVVDLAGSELKERYPTDCWRVLVGCAPCQPFSRYAQACTTNVEKWGLLNHFSRIVGETMPDVISMENVPELQRHSVYADFVARLKELKYHVSEHVVFCPDYGLAQLRSRLVLFASLRSKIELIPKTHTKDDRRTVEMEIGKLPALAAGEACPTDPLHQCANLSEKNLRRIRHSMPNGTWRDWPKELVAKCHTRDKGKFYASVYGRMAWDEPAPTITTQFFGFGSGRFGHPSQDRALSLREGANLQSFPPDYEFVKPGRAPTFASVGRMIGNAVPVRLGKVVGNSILDHLGSSGI